MADTDGIDFTQLKNWSNNLLGAGNDMISSAVGMGGELLNANQKLSDYSNALSGNTKIFGALKNVVNGLVQFAESSLDEYQTLTGIGATFGKEMVNIKRTAAELGLTTKDMIELLQNNSASLRTFGGTTDQAISRFRAFSKEILDSDAGTELRRLGFTAKDINQTLITYNELAQQDGLVNRRSSADQIASAKAFALELDALSKLTGKQKDELADEMKKRRREGDTQAFLMGQSAEAQEAFMMATTKISNTMGPQFADLFKDLMIRGAPITDETRNAFIALGGSADEFESTVASFQQGMQTNNFDAFNDSLTNAQGAFAGYLKTEEARNVAMLGGLSNVSAAMGQAYESSYEFANSLDAAAEGTETPAQTMQRIQQDILEQQQVQMTNANGLLDTTIDLQESLRDLTITATTQVLPRLEEAALNAINMFKEALPDANEMINQLGDGISNMFNAAEASIYPGGMGSVLTDYNAATNDAIGQAADQITGASSETTATVSETAAETAAGIAETQSQITEVTAETTALINSTQTQISETEQRINSLQDQKAEMLANGLQETDGAVMGVSEQLEQAKRELLQAQANAYTAARIADYQTGKPIRGFSKGGRIEENELAIVGEDGPEFVTGSANVMSTNSSAGVLQNLMKTIGSVQQSVQENTKNAEAQISNTSAAETNSNEILKRFDTMNSLLQQLVYIENDAAGTARRTMKATKGLQGNMLKGISV